MLRAEYSPLKIFHHQDRLGVLVQEAHAAPIHIQLVPTNRCNHNCKGCAYRNKDYASSERFDQRDEMPWSKLVEVVCNCAEIGVKAIQLTGGGEPTMHPRFLDLCQLILDSGLALAVVTNGSRWSSEYTNVLSQAAWVRFSIDAGNPETYATYRGVADSCYDKVRANIKDLVRKKPSSCIVGVGHVVGNHNWCEIASACRNARDDGVDNFRISALFQQDGIEYFRGFYDKAQGQCRQAKALETDEFIVFDLFGDRIDDMLGGPPDYSWCGYSRVATYLGADQNLYTCCMYAYNNWGLLGSFAHRSFTDLWFADSTIAALDRLDARKCERCMFNNKNRTIAYAADPHPRHVEFV